MAAFDLATQRVVLTKISTPLKPGALVKPQRLLALLLQSLGFSSITIGTIAPVDQESLWYNKDNDTFRRYNPLTSTWSTMVPSQWVLHLFQMGMKAAAVEGLVDNADKLPFFDVSANEMKMISSADYKASLGVSGWIQYGSTQTLGAPASSVEFDLPTAYTSFLLRSTFSPFGGNPTKFNPRLRGVYPTNVAIDLSAGLSGAFSGTVNRYHLYSGDRGDLTGFIRREIIPEDVDGTEGNSNGRNITLSNRIAKIRLAVPDGTFDGETADTWQFAIGSVFKLFVR